MVECAGNDQGGDIQFLHGLTQGGKLQDVLSRYARDNSQPSTVWPEVERATGSTRVSAAACRQAPVFQRRPWLDRPALRSSSRMQCLG